MQATRCRLVKDVDGLYEADPAGRWPTATAVMADLLDIVPAHGQRDVAAPCSMTAGELTVG